jgi:predicted amidophosphoribosyltransferase
VSKREDFIHSFCDTCLKPSDHGGCGQRFRQILEPIRCPSELLGTHDICPFCLDIYSRSRRHEQFCPFAQANLRLRAGGWATRASTMVLRSIRQAASPYREPLVNLIGVLLAEIRAENSIIIPLPMGSARQGDRWIKMVLDASKFVQGAEVVPLIRRNKQQSTRKSVAQVRAKIAQGEYDVDELSGQKILNRRVVLLDDNVTTGNTITNCAGLLEAYKPEQINLLTVDRTVPARALQRCPEPKSLLCQYYLPSG